MLGVHALALVSCLFVDSRCNHIISQQRRLAASRQSSAPPSIPRQVLSESEPTQPNRNQRCQITTRSAGGQVCLWIQHFRITLTGCGPGEPIGPPGGYRLLCRAILPTTAPYGNACCELQRSPWECGNGTAQRLTLLERCCVPSACGTKAIQGAVAKGPLCGGKCLRKPTLSQIAEPMLRAPSLLHRNVPTLLKALLRSSGVWNKSHRRSRC